MFSVQAREEVETGWMKEREREEAVRDVRFLLITVMDEMYSKLHNYRFGYIAYWPVHPSTPSVLLH